MRYVRYIGRAHQRIITPQEWRGVGITADTAVWNAMNGFAIPADQFTEAQMKKAINGDSDLVLTDEDEEFEPTPQTRDMTPAELIQVTENPVDVIALLNGEGAAPNGNVTRPAPEVNEAKDNVEDQGEDLTDSDTRTNQDRIS